MDLSEPVVRARRPIRWKIFGIAATLLLMMIVVTLFSSLSLRRVGQQLEFLSTFYIELDQTLADARIFTLRQLLASERVLADRPDISFAEARKLAAHLGTDAAACDRGQVRAGLQKAGHQLSRENRRLVAYEFVRLCATRELEAATKLLEAAVRHPLVLADPAQLTMLVGMQQRLSALPELHERLNLVFENFYTNATRKGDPQVLDVIRTHLEQTRRDMSSVLSGAIGDIHAATRESAARARTLERRAQVLSWIVTAAACAIGLAFAYWVSRNLVRPVLDLLRGTRAVEKGDLSVKIEVRTHDEIAQLAGSFNHMVGELRQKEQIKEMFGKYVDPRVVQGLLAKETFAQAGERRLMTVFFSDLQGFTTLSERLTPDGLVKLLNHYFTHMAEAIRGQHGIIDKYIGDSVMAFWGPPFTGETDHARLACLAALDQRRRMEEFVRQVPEILGIRKGLPDLRVRMGISTGDVTVGSIGSDDARSYTVIGDTVNLASRLEGVNKQYKTEIIVSEDTRRLAQDILECRELDSVRVVGRQEPVRLYELMAKKGELTAAQAKLRERFEAALAAYRAGKWDDAEAGFKAALEVVPTDGPSNVFLARVAKLRSGDIANWEGVWNLSEK